MRITGLIISSQGEVSVGRATKRKIKALVHQFLKGGMAEETTSYLVGYVAYLKGVEPGFISALEKKYGLDGMQALYSVKPVRRKPVYDSEKALIRMLLLQHELGQR